MKYSMVIPVFNRPDELCELLESLCLQSFNDFEVIVVDDGSNERSDTLVDSFRDKLQIQYYYKQNSGPGPSRNFGFKQARGSNLMVFDSDCVLPPSYMEIVDRALKENGFDAWGGPDRPSGNFTSLQQAMGFTMSSFLTTGGIRGHINHLDWFQPRSFNMGMTRVVFERTGGFGTLRYAEDIELSIRIRRAGFQIGLIPDAFVYHRRRTSLGQFYRQVYHFGAGRASITQLYPDQERVTHWLPFIFTLGLLLSVALLPIRSHLAFFGLGIYALFFIAILIEALRTLGKPGAALLCLPAACVQLVGYGLGFIVAKMKH